MEQATTPERDENLYTLAAAAAATLAAWAVVSALPPMPVRVGGTSLGMLVPAHYLVSVFPAFAAFAATLALDVHRRRAARTWAPRAMLLAATGVVAVLRLEGLIPFVGPALFLAAALAYELTSPADRDSYLVMGAVIAGLLVTGWYKLVVWGDAPSFAASSLAGAALGAALARWGSTARTR